MSLPMSSFGPLPKVARGKGREFTLHEQHEIISYCEEVLAKGHKITNKALCEWVNSKFNNFASPLTIGRLLKRKVLVIFIGVGDVGASKRVKKAQCPEVEMVTFNWFLRMQENGVALLDDLVVASAKRFYALLPRDENEKELQFLNGWI